MPNQLNELVMVVPSNLIFQFGRWQGLWLNYNPKLIELIKTSYSFLPRSQVGYDPSWQQIIPYQVFTCGNSYYVAQKLQGSTEKRLHQKYMLGVGGHINPEDVNNTCILEAGIEREWQEEILYTGNLERNLIGILKDNLNDVSTVHLALVYLVKGDNYNICTSEPTKMQGKMYLLQDIDKIYEEMDSWGQIVYKHLCGEKNICEWIK